MRKERPSQTEEEVVTVTRLIPTKFEEVERLIPVDFEEHQGKLIPTDFARITRFLPTEFIEIEVPTLIPKT